MKLLALKPRWLKRQDSHNFLNVDSIIEADGVCFLCPVCFVSNNGSVGTHSVICWAPSVPQDTLPTPGRWTMQGTSFDDLTLVAGSSSVQLQADCHAHFFVRGGQIQLC